MHSRSRAKLGLFILCFFLPLRIIGNPKTLQEEVEAILISYQSKANIGLHVTSLRESTTLFTNNAKELFYPGDALKLFVAAAAFEILGPQFAFRTEISTNGLLEAGFLKGNLFLKGSGDPSFMLEDLEDLVLQLKQKHIKEIAGDLVIDCSEFDDIRLGPGWIWEEKLHAKYTPVEALVLNQGLVDFWIKPSEVAMMSPVVQLEPLVPGVAVENKAIMAQIDPFQKSLKVKKKQSKGKDIIVVEGAMSLKAPPLKFAVPVQHPAHFAATEFSLLLKKHGIKHEGKILFEAAQGDQKLLASHSSSCVFDLIRKMLKTNNALFANSFLKKIGRVRYGKPGTWPNGCQTIREFLMRMVSKDLGGAVIVDGSGESNFNKLSPELMTLFLKNAHHHYVYAPELMACMPLSGVDGCFKKRFKQKSFVSKLRGFSFILKEDSCLCGYLMTSSSQVLAFCLMIKQQQPYQESCAFELEERLCEALFKYAKG